MFFLICLHKGSNESRKVVSVLAKYQQLEYRDKINRFKLEPVPKTEFMLLFASPYEGAGE